MNLIDLGAYGQPNKAPKTPPIKNDNKAETINKPNVQGSASIIIPVTDDG